MKRNQPYIGQMGNYTPLPNGAPFFRLTGQWAVRVTDDYDAQTRNYGPCFSSRGLAKKHLKKVLISISRHL